MICSCVEHYVGHNTQIDNDDKLDSVNVVLYLPITQTMYKFGYKHINNIFIPVVY